jgi:transmembrane sensor
MTSADHNSARRQENILETAAQWFDRLQHEELTAPELAAWQQWLAQSPAHRDAFDQLQDLWQRLGEVPSPPLAGETQRAADRYTGGMPVAQWLSRGHRLGRRLAAHRRLAAAVLLAVVAGGAGVWPLWQLYSTPKVTVFETRSGEHRDVTLPDGSMLSLGARSLVWIHFEPGRREVNLDRGEAYFEVARDRSRPFMVRAGTTSITAVGTAFNVRRNGARVLVAVTEGTVAVAAGPASQDTGRTLLDAGHQLVVDPADGTPVVSQAGAQSAVAWRAGRLQYLDEPLQYVVADVNRYSAAEILIADPTLGELRVTGTVLEDDIDGWLQSLEKFMPLRVRRLAGGAVRLERQD